MTTRKIFIENTGRLWHAVTGGAIGLGPESENHRAYNVHIRRFGYCFEAAEALCRSYHGKTWEEVTLPEYLAE